MLPSSMLAASSRRRGQGESMNDLAYRAIKARIVALEMPPASVVDETALVDELGVGLTPVRQALRRLALENLVVILPRRGTLVADLNASDLSKIYEMRVELETLAARLAAERATPQQQRRMQELSLEATHLTAPIDSHTYLEIDHRMHLLLWQSAHNEFLEETLDGLFSHALRLWNFAVDRAEQLDKVLEQAIEEHVRIFELIIAHDEAGAAQLMRRHINRFQHEMLQLF